MNTDDGMYIASQIDTSEFDKGIDHIQNKIVEAASSIEGESARIQSLFTDIPKIDFSPLANMSSLDDVELGFQQVGRVIEENRAALTELEAKYQELKTAAGEAFMSGDDSQYVALSQEAQATEAVIRARKRAIKEAEKYDEELVNLCKEMNKEAAEAEKERQKQEKSAEALAKKERSAASLRTRIRELTMEAAALRDAAQQEGVEIDKSTGRYREIIEELGRLRDIQGDIQAAGNVFANDENQFAGVISGLTGLSGAFSAAQGAVGLFAGENEHLQEIMLKVQSLMAITMGLQQVQQTLNKDSAFSLVTLNSLKKMWNKLLGTSATAQAQETAATESATVAQSAHATATVTDTAATEADTAAQEAKNAATVTGTTATATNTTATQGATAAQNAHTGAMVAGTVATKAMSVAMRVLKLALISTGIGALIVLVGELVSWITDLVTAEDEAKKHTEDLNKAHEEAGKTYAEEKIALEDNIKACQTFKGTKEQEKKKVDELNSKYGEALGYYDSLEQWERVLTERGPAYCKLMQLKAERQGILNKYVESYCELLAVQHKAENGDYDAWYRTKAGDLKKRQEEINKQKRITDQWEADLRRQDAIIEQFQKNNNLDEVHIDPKAKTINGSGMTFDPKAAAREQRKLLQQFQEEVAKYISDTNKSLTQNMIDGIEAGYDKELITIRKNAADRETAWKQSLLGLAEAMRDNTHAIFMSKKGATEEAWESSDEGKRSLEDWVNELLKNETIRDNYEQGLNDIHEAVNTQFASVREKYMNQLIDEFGSYNDKFDKLSLEWQKKIKFIGARFPSFLPQALEQMEEDFAALDLEEFKKSINWDVIFGNVSNLTGKQLKLIKKQLQEFYNSSAFRMGATPEQLKTIADAMEKINEAERDNSGFFAGLSEALSRLDSAKIRFENAKLDLDMAKQTGNKDIIAIMQKRYNEAQSNLLSAQGAVGDATDSVVTNFKTVSSALASLSNEAGISLTELGGTIETLINTFGNSGSKIGGIISAALSLLDAIGKQGLDGFVGKVLNGVSQGVGGVLDTVGGIFGIDGLGGLFNGDSRKEKRIESLQGSIDSLTRSNTRLERANSKLYSREKASNYGSQIDNLEAQKRLILQQMAEEEAKKDTNDDRIQEWRNQIEDIGQQIADLKEAAKDAIIGEDITTSIDNFATAMGDAWGRTADKAKAVKDYVRSMLRQMVVEAMKTDLTQPITQLREMMLGYMSDGIVSDVEQTEAQNFMSKVGKDISDRYKWADSILGGSASGQDGATKGEFATATQDSVDELGGRAAAIQICGEMRRALLEDISCDTSVISHLSEEGNTLISEMRDMNILVVSHLDTIARNTNQLYEMNERLGKIERNTR